jgi:hypothetical protein
MANKASNRTVPAKQPELVKALGQGYVLTPAPSGQYSKLAPKGGKTICWLIPGKTYVRLHFIAATEGAPKTLLKDTWAGSAGMTQLKATSENLDQARSLIKWAADKQAK